MSKVIVGSHPHGITLNAMEYLVDDEGDVIEFASAEEARDFLRAHGVTDGEMNAMFFLHSVGTCKRCGFTLYPNMIGDYKTQCFNCDEDFFDFEQEAYAD